MGIDILDTATRTRELLYALDPQGEFHAGSAEPWIANLLGALLIANDTHIAIEIGGFQGYSSKRIAQALGTLPHATAFTVCEIDPARAQDVQTALEACAAPSVRCTVVCDDSHRWLPTLPVESVDFAWLDGNHEAPYVTREIELLWPKMRAGGLICGHDVFGVCDLQAVFARFGGYSLDLPRLGPAGGLGVIQVRA